MRHSGGEPEPSRPPRAHGDAAPGGRRDRGARPAARLGRRRPRRAAVVVLGLRVHDRRHPGRAAVRRRALCGRLHPPARREEAELLAEHAPHARLLRPHPRSRAARRPAPAPPTPSAPPSARRDRDRPPGAAGRPGATPPRRIACTTVPLGRARGHPRPPPRGRGGRAHRRDALTPGADGRGPRRAEALAAALDESLDDLRADPDLRRAIVAAYARMETRARRSRAAAATPPRRRSSTSSARSSRLDTSAEAVRRLTELFEWARFSHHEPEPSMRDDAVDALVAVRDELRASELVPA